VSPSKQISDDACSRAAADLLCWYSDHGRDLPWRRTKDPYAIWLSEIMLQQTTVTSVLPYFKKFIDTFPDIEKLAAAPVEVVIEMWAGLGYYRRARNLHVAARQVCEHFQGKFPDTSEAVESLPGIGRSTAGAILSIAFGKPIPVLDANVRRVLSRMTVCPHPVRSVKGEKELWYWAEKFTSREQPGDYAQAIMDLGATVCVPKQPDCLLCPWQQRCHAYAEGATARYPIQTPRKKVRKVRGVVIVAEWRGHYLIRRRSLEGMLAGLWEFPDRHLRADESEEEAVRNLLPQSIEGTPICCGRVNHQYSHFHISLQVYHVKWRGKPLPVMESSEQWVSLPELKKMALHGAHKKALQQFIRQGK